MPSGQTWRSGRNVLVVVAAPSEAKAVAAALNCNPPICNWEPVPAGEGWSLIRSGVGKVNATIATTRALATFTQPPIVLNLGVCGALPSITNSPALPLLSIVLATASGYSDEGALTTTGFIDMSSLGFPMWDGASADKGRSSLINTDPPLRATLESALRPHFTTRLHLGPIATVSTCSGTDAAAHETAARTSAIAEAMEGAAIAHALQPIANTAHNFAELRVVSNTTGDRDKQTWDLPGSLAMLTQLTVALRSA
jgi:futalosine hydrolase